MVVHYPDIEEVAAAFGKADAPLIVYADAVLPFAVAVKRLKAVGGAVRAAFAEKGIRPLSIVFDNGSEFARFRELEEWLKTSIYFADPHSPWQRGMNENMNGCLRFFFPRGMDFRTLDDDYLDTVVSLLNNRPRKCLGLKTPTEVFCCASF